MKWFNKYVRSSFNKQKMLDEIEQHGLLIAKTNDALDRLEKLTLDGEEHWLEETELECTIDSVRLTRSDKDGSFTGVARAHCRS